jgi:hypothetical protein
MKGLVMATVIGTGSSLAAAQSAGKDWLDLDNQRALEQGAAFAAQAGNSATWQPMDSAPRDGTVIEVRCTYGVAPWFGLYKWSSHMKFPDRNGVVVIMTGTPRWVGANAGKENSSFAEGGSFMWRPYTGDPVRYTDPTGGMQDSAAYWRGAVAAKYGLPLNAFEDSARSNAGKQRKASWWQRLLGIDP